MLSMSPPDSPLTKRSHQLLRGWCFRTRVENFPIFEKLVYVTTSIVLRILMENIETKKSLDSKLQIDSIYSIGILNILKVIIKIAEP